MNRILKLHKGWAWAALALVLLTALPLEGAAISGRSLRFKPQNTPTTLIPGPEEGECAWNDATNLLQCYTGSAWADVGFGVGTCNLDQAYDAATQGLMTVDGNAVTLNSSHATNICLDVNKSAGSGNALDITSSGTNSGNLIDLNMALGAGEGIDITSSGTNTGVLIQLTHAVGNTSAIDIIKSGGSGDGIDITSSGTNTGIPFQINHAVGDTTGLDIAKSGGSGDAMVITTSGTNTGAAVTITHAVGNTTGIALAKSGGSGDAIDITSSGTQSGILLDINQAVGNAVAVDIDKSSATASGAVTIDVTGGTGIPLAVATDQDIGVATLTKTGVGAGAVLTIANSGTGNDITGDAWTITTAGQFTGTTSGSYTGDETHTATATTGTGFDFDARTITTGTGLRVRYDESTLNGGFPFAVYGADGVANHFTIAENGAATVAGSAAGTDALTLTAGDLRVTSGHEIISAGNLTVDDGLVVFEDETGAVTQFLLDHKAGNMGDNLAMLLLDDGGNPVSGSNMLRLVPTGTPAAGSIGLEFVGASKVMQAIYADSDTTANSVVEVNSGGARADNIAGLMVLADGAGAAGSSVLRVAQSGTPGAATSYLVDFDNSGATMTQNPVGVYIHGGTTTNDSVQINATGAIADDKAALNVIHGTGAIANGGAIARIAGTANAAGATAYGLIISANGTNLEALSVELGKSTFAEEITSTGEGVTLNDNTILKIGTAGADGQLTSNGSTAFYTATTGLSIGDGTANNAHTIASTGVDTVSGTGQVLLQDAVEILFGTAGAESEIASDATNTEWKITSGNLQVGDGASTNYTAFANATGKVSFAGTARPTKYLFFPAREFQPEGANPSVMTVATHAIGWGLDPASDEAITTSFRIPDNWATGTDATAKIYWAANDALSTVVRFDVITVPLAEDELTSGAGNTDTLDDTEVSATAYDLNVTGAITIAASTEWAAGDLIFLSINRDANHANDTLAADCIVLGIEIAYTASQI